MHDCLCSIVDDSGVWGSGGMFSALNKLSAGVQEAYEAAHTAGDLHVGDLHLLSLDGDNKNLWVGLGVVQSFDRRRKTPRSDISLPGLEACLRKVTSSAAAMSGMHLILGCNFIPCQVHHFSLFMC